MTVSNAGYNHCHDSDFIIERPNGSGDNLLLLLKTDTIFTVNGKDIRVPSGSLFIYKKGRPQYYRCVPHCTFENDWVHFEFEGDEEKEFFELGLKYETPVKVSDAHFISFCIKSITNEAYSSNINREKSIYHYMFLIFNKISEQQYSEPNSKYDSSYEMISTVRNKMYSYPYEQRNVGSSAHEVRMSVSGFQHLYKKYFGVSFTQDLITARIEYAKMLLLSTNLNINEISRQSGCMTFALKKCFCISDTVYIF